MFDVGKRIKERRIELGLSAEELAPMVGLSPATIYRYENGEIKKVNTTKLQPFAKALKTTEAYLMGWSEKIENNQEVQEDDELYELREAMRRNPKVRILFSAARGIKEEHIELATAMLNALKGNDDSLE